jgi:uncharacterized protein (TIGR01777 family)
MSSSKFVARSPMPVSAAELARWHLREGAFERLCPPWERIEAPGDRGPIHEGQRVELRLRAGPLRIRWTALHRDLGPDGFRDVQVEGPFARWEHRHRFEALGEEASRLADEIEYRLPGGFLGRVLAGGALRRRLRRTFTYRHALLAGDLARHRGLPRSRVAVSGASGLVGSALVAFLRAGGHEVRRLVRREARAPDEIGYDIGGGRVDSEALEGLDGLVHLAGESIAAGRWTEERRRRIRASRVDSTRLFAASLAALRRPPRCWINASAVGYYGDRGDEPLDEASPGGRGFLADTCREWEAAAEPAESAGVRLVRLRIGVVLAAAGGALARMVPPFLLGLGGRLGSGRQYMSWISLDDLVGLIHFLLQTDGVRGAVNAVAPAPLPNAEFVQVLGTVLRRPALLPLPGAAIGLLMGEMGRALLLEGARVLPRRALDAGFRFRHPSLEQALRFELGRFDPSGPAPLPEFEERR